MLVKRNHHVVFTIKKLTSHGKGRRICSTVWIGNDDETGLKRVYQQKDMKAVALVEAVVAQKTR